jgi:gliding motility-associated-like protein
MKVFNRWGVTVFDTHNKDGRGWDGRWNPIDQPSDVYTYQIVVWMENGAVEQYDGNVTLLR